jgi:hypothetical protein
MPCSQVSDLKIMLKIKIGYVFQPPMLLASGLITNVKIGDLPLRSHLALQVLIMPNEMSVANRLFLLL